MWMSSYTSNSDDPFQKPPFVNIRYLAYTDNLPAWSYGYHQHEDIYELVFIVESSGMLLLEHDKLPLNAGDIVIIPPHTPHGFSCGTEECMKYCSFCIDPKAQSGPFLDFLSEIHWPSLVSARKYLTYIQSSFQILVELHQLNKGQLDETYRSVCLGLFMLIKKIYQYRSMVIPIDSSSYASDVLWYIDQHCGEDISLNSLAKHFNISVSHLRRVFKQVYDISPIAYLIKHRIEVATVYLLETDMSVTEIARQVGYDNTTHFSHLFTDRIGCTPSEFRAQKEKLPVFDLVDPRELE